MVAFRRCLGATRISRVAQTGVETRRKHTDGRPFVPLEIRSGRSSYLVGEFHGVLEHYAPTQHRSKLGCSEGKGTIERANYHLAQFPGGTRPNDPSRSRKRLDLDPCRVQHRAFCCLLDRLVRWTTIVGTPTRFTRQDAETCRRLATVADGRTWSPNRPGDCIEPRKLFRLTHPKGVSVSDDTYPRLRPGRGPASKNK